MFCPQCSNEILSERARFCTRCSFPLATVKELVETEAAKSRAEEEKKDYPLRQLDISLGSGLMIIGLIIAEVTKAYFRGKIRDMDGDFLLTFILGMFFSGVLMFSRLSPRQSGLTLGATIIFLGSLIGIRAGLAFNQFPALLTIVGIFLLISLFWVPLSGALTRLYSDKEPVRVSPNQAPLQPMFKAVDTAPAVLSQMQSSEVVEINPQEMKTEERVQPFSITEDSTSLLNKG